MQPKKIIFHLTSNLIKLKNRITMFTIETVGNVIISVLFLTLLVLEIKTLAGQLPRKK